MDKDVKKDTVKMNKDDQQSLREQNTKNIPKVLVVDDRNDFGSGDDFFKVTNEYDRQFNMYRPEYPWEDFMKVNSGIPDDPKKDELNANKEEKYKVNKERIIRRRKAKLKNIKSSLGIPVARDYSNIPIGVSRVNAFIYSTGVNGGTGRIGTNIGYAGMASAGFQPNLGNKYSQKQIDYVKNNWTNSVNACGKFGLDPIIELAQGAKESGWGTSKMAREGNAFFGIKATKSTNEYWSGERIGGAAGSFRAYSSPQNSFYDHARLISESSRYIDAYNGAKRNYKEYANKIANSAYIVDSDNRPKYEKDVANIYETIYTIAIQLKLFDPATAQKIATTDAAKASPNTGTGRVVSPTGPSAGDIPELGEKYPSVYKSPIVPNGRPASTREQIVKLTNNYSGYPYIVGLRGYFKELGRPNKNDRGLYDDAIFFVTSNEMFAFNANTDPGWYGYNSDSDVRDGVATLKEGTWEYVIGTHRGSTVHEALVQHGNFTVYRDGHPNSGKKKEVTGKFGINMHRGGPRSVSSSGCQTIPPGQWNEFFYQTVKKYVKPGQIVKYFLIKV